MTAARPRTPQVAETQFSTQTLLSVAELSSTPCFNISPEAASKQAKLCSTIPCSCCSVMSKQELLFQRHKNQKNTTTSQNNRHDEKVDLQAGHPPGETDQSPWHCANGLRSLFPSYPPIAVSVAEQASAWYCAGRYYLWDKKEQGRLQIHFIRLFPCSLYEYPLQSNTNTRDKAMLSWWTCTLTPCALEQTRLSLTTSMQNPS